MLKYKLLDVINKLDDDLLSNQAIIKNNLHLFTELKNEGYTYKAILKEINRDKPLLTECCFNTYRKRAKYTNNHLNNKKNKIAHTGNCQLLNGSNIETTKTPLKTWQASFHFFNELMLQDIERNGFTIDDVRKWKVNTPHQFSKALQQAIQSNKFKLR